MPKTRRDQPPDLSMPKRPAATEDVDTVFADLKEAGWPRTVGEALSVSNRVGLAVRRSPRHILALLCECRDAPGRQPAERLREFLTAVTEGREPSAGLVEAEAVLTRNIEPSTGR